MRIAPILISQLTKGTRTMNTEIKNEMISLEIEELEAKVAPDAGSGFLE